MTKPEIVAYYCPNNPDVADAFRWKNVRCDSRSCDCTRDALIRLTDYERLQAEAERLQAANAINMPGLLEDLDEALEELELRGRHDDRGYQLLRAWYSEMRRVTRVVDAALAQQGKEGEC